jgi:8-oxo-dGTP pyrophosphatase MutT (NUDIX family)
MKPASIVHLHSAGGVVFKNDGDTIQVVLISVSNGRVWTFPKGLIDSREKLRKTALREVREETGLTARIISEIGESSYWYEVKSENVKYNKSVRFFLMEFVTGDVADHDREVATAEWFLLDTVPDMLTFKGDRAIMEKASKMIKRRVFGAKRKGEGKSE